VTFPRDDIHRGLCHAARRYLLFLFPAGNSSKGAINCSEVPGGKFTKIKQRAFAVFEENKHLRETMKIIEPDRVL
jgi:hypothetical protein